jgi:effector-binding domain-containing protein
MLPEIIALNVRAYAFVAHTVPLACVGSAAEEGFAALGAFFADHKMVASGAPFVKYRRIDMAGKLDIESGIPVAQAGTGNADVRFDILPAGRYGRLCWAGPYDELLAANAAVIGWDEENGIAWAMTPTDRGDIFDCRLESFRIGPAEEDNPQNWITEIAIRIADGRAAPE